MYVSMDTTKLRKCKLCGYNFTKIRIDIDRLAMATHFKISHPLMKKDYRKLIHNWRKIALIEKTKFAKTLSISKDKR